MSDFIIDAGIAIAVLTGLIYYECWLFLWLLRRCYAAHAFGGIAISRESYLVVGAYAFNWCPFYAVFLATVAVASLIYPFLPGTIIAHASFWIFIAVFVLFSLEHLTLIRANTMFYNVARKQFSFHPEVTSLSLVGEQESEEIGKLKKHIIDTKFRMLERDSKKIVIFKPHWKSETDLEKVEDIEVVEIPVSQIVALAVKGTPHFHCQPGAPVWKRLWRRPESAVGA